MENITHKICSKCKALQEITKFSKRPDRKNNSYASHCNNCIKQASRARTRSKRQTVYNILKHSGGCIDCGLTEIACLDFDHKKDKITQVSKMLFRNYPIEDILKEIEKCEIRCANCHRIKTAKERNYYKHIK